MHLFAWVVKVPLDILHKNRIISCFCTWNGFMRCLIFSPIICVYKMFCLHLLYISKYLNTVPKKSTLQRQRTFLSEDFLQWFLFECYVFFILMSSIPLVKQSCIFCSLKLWNNTRNHCIKAVCFTTKTNEDFFSCKKCANWKPKTLFKKKHLLVFFKCWNVLTCSSTFPVCFVLSKDPTQFVIS